VLEGCSWGRSLASASGVGLAPVRLSGGADSLILRTGVEWVSEAEELETAVLMRPHEAFSAFLLPFFASTNNLADGSGFSGDVELVWVEPSSVALESVECLRARLASGAFILSSSPDESEDGDEDDDDELFKPLSSLSSDSGRGIWAANARLLVPFEVYANDSLFD